MAYWMRVMACVLCVAPCFGKTIVVTSASGELGSAVARELAKDHKLILTGRNMEKLEALKKELGQGCEIRALDFTSAESIAAFRVGDVDGLVLIGPRPGFYGKNMFPEEKEWLDVFKAGFTGPVEVMKNVLSGMQRGGSVVIMAGTTSAQVQPSTGPACVLRRMWTTYSKALSHELGSKEIRVNALSPGVISTGFHKERITNKGKAANLSYEEQLNKEVAPIPAGRNGDVAEVAKAVRFLVTDESSFINGVNLVLDGGFTVSY